LLFVVSACATRSYHHESTNSFPIRERAITQSEDDISISASVPDAGEAKAIFGVPVYKRGIQPVWLEIVNNSPDRIRFAPTGVDPIYFSPLEVSYMHRKGFSKEARAQMDRRFHDSAMPRQIPAGETRSGYVFTHASPGTKSFNIDVYSAGTDYSLAFFLTVPGFIPDHAAIDFETLSRPEEIHEYELAGFRDAVADLPNTTSDQTGQQTGLPYGTVIVADGLDVLKSLLRAGWYETSGMHKAWRKRHGWQKATIFPLKMPARISMKPGISQMATSTLSGCPQSPFHCSKQRVLPGTIRRSSNENPANFPPWPHHLHRRNCVWSGTGNRLLLFTANKTSI